MNHQVDMISFVHMMSVFSEFIQFQSLNADCGSSLNQFSNNRIWLISIPEAIDVSGTVLMQ